MIATGNKNFSPEELLQLAKSANGKKPEDLLSAMQNRLPENGVNEIKRILGDKKALEELLKSEQAQKIMRQFGKK
ncbi:MAG: hypothetical protein IJB16_04995 [Clostridia bacterium]|nr:hypothetical protein [Clostridia bacterium]